jgi:hypothetical protein
VGRKGLDSAVSASTLKWLAGLLEPGRSQTGQGSRGCKYVPTLEHRCKQSAFAMPSVNASWWCGRSDAARHTLFGMDPDRTAH